MATVHSDAFHRPIFRIDYPHVPEYLHGRFGSRFYSLDQFWSDHQFTPDLFQRALAGCLHGPYTEPNLMLTRAFYPLVGPQELLAVITQWVQGQAERLSSAESARWLNWLATLCPPQPFQYGQPSHAQFRGLPWADFHRAYGLTLDPSNYTMVAEGTAPGLTPEDVAEQVFDDLTLHPPTSYSGTTPTIGDVCVVAGQWYYCDTMTWIPMATPEQSARPWDPTDPFWEVLPRWSLLPWPMDLTAWQRRAEALHAPWAVHLAQALAQGVLEAVWLFRCPQCQERLRWRREAPTADSLPAGVFCPRCTTWVDPRPGDYRPAYRSLADASCR